MIQDFVAFLLIVLGMVSMLFLITYGTLRFGKGRIHELTKAQRHPYRFTLLLAVGTIIGATITYLFQYSNPSPVETLGYLVFFEFLLISFFAITFGFRLFNLEKKLAEKQSRDKGAGRGT